VNDQELRDSIALRAAGCYRPSGRWAYHFARAKLKYDPFYSVLLAEGLIPADARIVDLGCGQGLLAAWLIAAQQSYAEGVRDSARAVPAAFASYRGIDRNASEIRRARQALGRYAEFEVGDIAAGRLSGGTVIVLLDVLHYLDGAAQIGLLRRICDELPIQGLLLLRVGDSDGSLPARLSGWVDRVVAWLRGGGAAPLSRRSLARWVALLGEVGFSVQVIARQRSVAHTNCLLRAYPRPT
jgi:SAM-dependent methyltransferase